MEPERELWATLRARRNARDARWLRLPDELCALVVSGAVARRRATAAPRRVLACPACAWA
jgi:hypothetical protein